MTYADAEWYFRYATQLAALSVTVENSLTQLDGTLDVSRSAGAHSTAGTSWGQNYDQAAWDVFEIGSFVAIAAGNLAELVHAAGVNHADAQSNNAPQEEIPVSPAPVVAAMEYALRPGGLSVGGVGDFPDRWDLVADRVSKQWADCVPNKISSAGDAFSKFSSEFAAYTLAREDVADPPPEVPMINAAVDRVLTSLFDASQFASFVSTACTEVADKSDTEREQIKAVLLNCDMFTALLEVTANAPVLGPFAKAGIEKAIEAAKATAAENVDTLLVELDGFVAGAISKTAGISSGVTGSVQLNLAPMLGKYARQSQPVRGRPIRENWRAGALGEVRAGVIPSPKTSVNINGRRRIPDRIDVTNGQVTEVKNTNSVKQSETQIKDELAWAQSQNYTMTLIVDHRTEVTPDIQKLVDDGKISLIRAELDDNLPTGQKPTPFIPDVQWTPPITYDPKDTPSGIPSPQAPAR
ncbi:hypothetical protein JGU71_07595 [Antrihabitans sp. YC3-6]|uniref:Tox-REase-7 domain-containing protein n=1 Tax=Antrihabitans stalagmiti TaxID=2799499 RepID=A0A934U291_9NOCA|nr:putative toxin [Antrihabitans stalagmiti]MBJ8338746.1 hypothetical protein [Antrihabitans stalagmiti]